MPLVVRPIEHEDVAQCVALRVAALGSLVIGRPPPYPGYVEEAEASVHRDLDSSAHVRHLKVVDVDNESEVIAYAKWEIYEHGRPDVERLLRWKEELAEEKERGEQVDQFSGLRDVAHEYFSTRNAEMGRHPHILLALLVTASQHRRRGAGSLLVQWGVDLSEHTGLNAYVQASEQGRRLYAHHGFKALETVQFHLEKYGLEGVERMTEMMRKPSVRPGEEAESPA